MRLLTIDGKYMSSKELMYVHLNRVFSFPSYFGNNLDALWDLLNENDEPAKIEFLNVDLAREYLGSYGENLVRLLKKLEQKNANYTVFLYKKSSYGD